MKHNGKQITKTKLPLLTNQHIIRKWMIVAGLLALARLLLMASWMVMQCELRTVLAVFMGWLLLRSLLRLACQILMTILFLILLTLILGLII
ncbi:MAG: hypothetical protein Q8861_00510 [Bacteroidota bacterium]|nr:hypothetical protein [Bacteroidota bacterium]MDP4268509.1 hypothetical protein [Bacteroidota bacterium]